MKRDILCEYLPKIYEQAQKIEQNEAELRAVLEHRDLASSRISTEISDRSDYLRLAIRLAVGLTGNRARSQADKYLAAMRPFFLRGESSSAMKRALEQNGVAKLVALGRSDARRRTILITNLSDEILTKLSDQKPGGYFLACIRTGGANAGANPVIEIPDPSLLFPIGVLVKRKSVA